jgi:nucleotide-binding universal stress UspA family protein
MSKRILAPVNDREPSESIVPVLGALARDFGATIRLLRVLPVPTNVVGSHGRVVAYVDQEIARLTAQGSEDLHRVEAQLDGVPVETVVRFGEPVEEILLEAEAFDADLIALTRGEGGRLARALSPGVADRVADKALVPTLVLHG